jgi:hypothetical protein
MGSFHRKAAIPISPKTGVYDCIMGLRLPQPIRIRGTGAWEGPAGFATILD